jgi:hypothetical protein
MNKDNNRFGYNMTDEFYVLNILHRNTSDICTALTFCRCVQCSEKTQPHVDTHVFESP